MAVIYNQFLRGILTTHDLLTANIAYPFFDLTCRQYEAIRAALVEKNNLDNVFEKFGITEYQYRKALAAFREGGVAGLIVNSFPKLTEPFDLEAERMIYVLKAARPDIPATKMVVILQGFGFNIELSLMRRLYASYGWAHGLKKYDDIDFWAVNLRVVKLTQIQNVSRCHGDFFHKEDRLQELLEVFRLQDPKKISMHCAAGQGRIF